MIPYKLELDFSKDILSQQTCIKEFDSRIFYSSRRDLRYSSKVFFQNMGGDFTFLRRIYEQDRTRWNRNEKGKNIENNNNPNVGTLNGGVCTCPDGMEYNVADNNDNCASLACVNGKSGACNPYKMKDVSDVPPWQNKSVECDPAELILKRDQDLFKSYKYLYFDYKNQGNNLCISERNFHLEANSVPFAFTPIYTFRKYVVQSPEQESLNKWVLYMVGIISSDMFVFTFIDTESEPEYLLEPRRYNMNIKTNNKNEIFLDKSKDFIFIVQKVKNRLYNFKLSAFNYNDKVFGLQWTRKFFIDSNRATTTLGRDRYINKLYENLVVHKIIANTDAGLVHVFTDYKNDKWGETIADNNPDPQDDFMNTSIISFRYADGFYQWKNIIGKIGRHSGFASAAYYYGRIALLQSILKGVVSQMRVTLIDSETGQIIWSKIISGTYNTYPIDIIINYQGIFILAKTGVDLFPKNASECGASHKLFEEVTKESKNLVLFWLPKVYEESPNTPFDKCDPENEAPDYLGIEVVDFPDEPEYDLQKMPTKLNAYIRNGETGFRFM